jgi:Transglycosylase
VADTEFDPTISTQPALPFISDSRAATPARSHPSAHTPEEPPSLLKASPHPSPSPCSRVRTHQRLCHSFVEAAARRLTVPTYLVEMIIAIEDKRFWLHPGVDPLAIARATTMALSGSGRLQGGSTIPEQLLKLRSPALGRRSIRTRALRALLSVWLCAHERREDLIAEYFARAYFGRGATGVPTAASTYFCRHPSDLDRAQSFFLAERIALPNCFRPGRIRNILRRKHITSLLGTDVNRLPPVYGAIFGPAAARAMASQVTDLNAG